MYALVLGFYYWEKKYDILEVDPKHFEFIM